MKRFMYTCFVAFWASVLSISFYAVLASAGDPTADPQAAAQIDSAQLAQHATADDCWMAIDGIVYDFTAYIARHPTRPEVMTRWCGREASEAYHSKGYGRDHSAAADAAMTNYKIGVLAPSE